jgi:hypothetical protein
MVLTSVIATMQEVEIGRTMVEGQPEQKDSKTPSQQTSQVQWYTSAISAMQEA